MSRKQIESSPWIGSLEEYWPISNSILNISKNEKKKNNNTFACDLDFVQNLRSFYWQFKRCVLHFIIIIIVS